MMEIIKFDRIVSVNSQTQGHGAQNILEGEISPNKNWMCESGTEKAVLILQLERAAVLTSIHVGNAHSAFVEVLVGRAADSVDQFESFLPMSSFMNPHESKTGTNPNRTRFFTKTDFNEATASKAWDRIKVVCSQPFNKYVSYGLCFLKIHGEKQVKKSEALGKLDDRDEIQVGSFFKKKRSSAGDKVLTGWFDTQAGETLGEERILGMKKISEEMKAVEASSSSSSIAKTTEKTISEKKSKPSSDSKGEERKQPVSRAVGRRGEEDRTARKRKEETRKNDKPGNEETAKRRRPEEKGEKNKRPFGKLMEDVVLVISGFKNPLRGDIRNMALEMGAKYSADWEPHCTHLVCAYENTPKCQQVKGKGKIVKKEWVEMCYKDRMRYPWRRFALDKADTIKPESEEEVELEEESEDQIASTSTERCSEIEKKPKSNAAKTKHGGDDYDAATDDDEDKKEVDTSDYPMPYLPDIFSLKTFFLEPSLQNKAILERYIVAYNGVLTETFDEHVDFYVTDKEGAPVKLFQKKAPNVVAVKPSWIWEINSKQKCTPTTPHLVT